MARGIILFDRENNCNYDSFQDEYFLHYNIKMIFKVHIIGIVKFISYTNTNIPDEQFEFGYFKNQINDLDIFWENIKSYLRRNDISLLDIIRNDEAERYVEVLSNRLEELNIPINIL